MLAHGLHMVADGSKTSVDKRLTLEIRISSQMILSVTESNSAVHSETDNLHTMLPMMIHHAHGQWGHHREDVLTWSD